MTRPGGRLPVDLGSLVVPPDNWIAVQPGPVDLSTLSLLENRGYDQAPVYDGAARALLGLIETDYLRTLVVSGQPLRPDDPEVRSARHFLRIGGDIDITELLAALTRTRAILITEQLQLDEHESAEILHGLVTISDLNRHPVRAALYSVLATLESELARAIPRLFSDPWEWIGTLSEHHQVSILGYSELTRRKRVDVDPIAAATLSQLLQVVARHKAFLVRLGFRSRKDFEDLTGRIPDLRNCVMHPVRPLVLDQDDVSKTDRTVRAILDLTKRVENDNDAHTERAPQGAIPGG